MLDKITKGKGTMEDLDKLEELCYYIKENSLCGLGQTAPNPVLSTLKYFRDEYIAHIQDKRCPAGVCKELLQYAIDPQKCRGCTLCAKVCPAGAITGTVKQPHVIDPGQVHQVRRLHGEVPLRRDCQESKEGCDSNGYGKCKNQRRGSIPCPPASTILEAARYAGIRYSHPVLSQGDQ